MLATHEYGSIPKKVTSVVAKSVSKMSNRTQLTAKSTKVSNLERVVKDKLQYDWKNIYRRLNADDVDDTGKVPMSKFEKTLRQTNTFLSKEDLNMIIKVIGLPELINDLIVAENYSRAV